jgi:hypothetical protein
MKSITPTLLPKETNSYGFLNHRSSLIIIIISILAIIFSSTVYAQDEDEELHNENLKGIAKSLTFYCYQAIKGDAQPDNPWLRYISIQKYNARGQITEYKRYGRANNETDMDSYDYDQKGQLIKVRYKSHDDVSIHEIDYDNEGNRIEIRSYVSGELKYITTKKFKNKGLIEEDTFDIAIPGQPLRRIYTNDSKGNNILFKMIDRTGKVIVITNSNYDNKGKLSSYTTKNFEDNTTKNNSFNYKYYTGGKLKEETNYTGKYPNTKVIYDTNGNSLREINYSGDGRNEILSDEVFRYDKTDSHGNWTQRSRYNNGHRTRLEIRQIEY